MFVPQGLCWVLGGWGKWLREYIQIVSYGFGKAVILGSRDEMCLK